MRLPLLILVTALLSAQTAIAERWGSLTYQVYGLTVHIMGCDNDAKGEVIIPREIEGLPVTTIANRAFFVKQSITSVKIPDTVIHIGDQAFADCQSLLSAIIPDTVQTIGFSAFSGCKSLAVVEWSSNVTSIPTGTFERCKGLKTISIPEGVTEIKGAAFAASGLEEVNFPNSLKTIENRTFQDCQSLTSISIPSSVTAIAGGAFGGCTRLVRASLPEQFHSEAEANRIGLIYAWPNGFLLPDTDITGPEDSLEIRMAPIITVRGVPGTVKTIDFAESAEGPWKLWRVVVVASGGTSEVDLDAGDSKRFYRIR